MDYRAFFALLLLSILSSAYVQSAPLLNTLSASVDSTCLVIQPVSGDNSNTKFESTYNAESGDAKIFAVLTTASVSASLTIRLGSGSSVSLGDGVSSDSYSLSQGSNVFTVEAIDSSDSSIKTIYEFTIHLLSTNNKIKSLSFFDSSIDLTPNDFSSSITSYTLSTRPSTVSTIELKSLILDSQYAQWSLTSTSGDVCTSLSSPCIIKLLTKGGVTNITITVTPKSQTPTKVYTFTIRRQSDLALINTLSAAFSGQCLDISRQGTDLSFTAGATFDADQSPLPTIYITAKLTKATKESGAVLKIGPKDGSLTAAADNMPFAFSAVPGENKIAVTVFPEDPNVTPTTYLLTVTLASTHVTLLSATIKHSITSNGAESDPLTGPASITISAGTTDYSGFTVPSASAYAVVRVTLQDRYASVWSGSTSGSLTKCSDLSATHSVHLESFNGRYSRSSYRSSAFSYTTNTYKCVVPLMANGAVSDVIVQGVAADGVTKTSEYKFAIYRQSSLTKIHTLRAAFDDSCATINATDEANHFIIVSNLQHANLFIAASLTTLTALKGAVMTLTVGTASPIGLSDSSYSSAIPVSVGKTVLIISVTAEDSSIHQDYKVTVHLRSNDNAITDAKVAIGDSVDTLTTDGVMNQQMIEGSKLEYTGIKVKSSVKFIGLKHVTLSFAAASVQLVNGSTITDCKSSFGTEVRKHIRAVNPFARHSFVPLAPVSFSYDCGVIALNDAGNSTVLRIRVIPESITPTQDYTWTVYRQSNNVNIQSITASAAGSCLTVEKYAADDDYHYKAVANTPGAAYVTVKLSAAAASSNAVYVIGPRGTTGVSAADNVKSGPYSVIEGDNFIEITVTAEDTAVQRKYHLKFHVQSSAATLDAGATLQFLDGNSYVSTTTQIVAGTYSYTAITLPSTSTSVRFIGLSLTNSFANAVIRTKGNPNVACTAQYQNVETTTVHHIFTTASYSIVCDAVTIGAGGSTTTVELQVTAENGSDQKIYSFAVYRSLGASLKSLVVTKISDATPFSLTPSFSSSIQDYFLAVAYEVSSVIIIANVTDPSKQAVELNFEDYNPNNATATPYRLSLGDNIFNITVIAEDALSQMQYSIVIRRSLHINGALLSSLTLNGVEISPAFYNGIHSYTATVAASVAYFTVVAVPSDTNAKVEVSLTPQSPSYQRLNASDQYTSGPLYLDAAPSSNNLTIIVTASDAITKLSYFVVVHRQSPVSIQGDPLLTGFNGQTYNVHGIPDEYFNLISAQNLQLNALFTFIAKDDRDKDATPDAIKSIGAWHTAGTYITDIAIRLSSDALRITVEDSIPSSSSLASHQKLKGLVVQSGSSVTRRLMISFNGRNLTDHLKVGETISLNTLHDAKSTTKHHFSIMKRSAHEFRIVTQLLLIDISRAGSHMNIEARVKEGIDITRPAVSSRLSSMHGLLGQMWAREQKHSKDNLDLSEALLLDDSDLIDGRVDDYLISDGPFGINFAFNKFIDQKKNEKDLTI